MANQLVADRLAAHFGTCALCTARPQFVFYSRKHSRYVWRKAGVRATLAWADACDGCDQEVGRALDDESSLFEPVTFSELGDATRFRAFWRAHVLTLFA